MSDAFFCDRCGKAFSWTRKMSVYSKGFIWKSGLNDNLGNNFDLCENCIKDLRDFMNVYKNAALNEKGEEDV